VDEPVTETDITPVYVRFGPRPTQEMPLDWAEKMLTTWRERDPKRFGSALAEVVTGDR
jgi:hypothetical protein